MVTPSHSEAARIYNEAQMMTNELLFSPKIQKLLSEPARELITLVIITEGKAQIIQIISWKIVSFYISTRLGFSQSLKIS